VRFADELEMRLVALDFDVERIEGPTIELPDRGSVRTGPILIGRRAVRPSPRATEHRFLVSGHYDTVFEPDHPFRGWLIDPGDPGRAIGPGAADMKGGLVVLFSALEALAASGDLDRASWTVLFNADEEIGSLGSRPWIEAEARRATTGFVFESTPPSGAMTRSRRGLGQFHLAVRGRAAHAGSIHREGRSAILALAHEIIEIEALTDPAAGITVTVGTVEGGSKRNVVPEHAEAWIDVRYDRPGQGEAIARALERIASHPHVEGTQATLWGKLHRPPLVETPAIRRLLAFYAEESRRIGLGLPDPEHSGGGTDGSLMAGVGLPVLDAMGVRGGETHSDREFVILDSLDERALVTARFWLRLLDIAAP
jgi:glutamate carboxypeptidase